VQWLENIMDTAIFVVGVKMGRWLGEWNISTLMNPK
jgi:hypothetical protein